jgi:isocitrate dehydrogenase
MAYKDITPPAGGKITIAHGKLTVPENPIIPFIRGDGTGPDIWAASVRVFDAAVQKPTAANAKSPGSRSSPARNPSRNSTTGCPTTPSRPSRNSRRHQRARSPRPSAAASARSTSPCARCSISTSACARAIFHRRPSPVKHPEKVDMVIFRENTEDIYAGIEYAGGTPEAQKILDFIAKEFPKEFKKSASAPSPPPRNLEGGWREEFSLRRASASASSRSATAARCG